MLVCPQCFGESRALEELFQREGTPGDCPTCGSTGLHLLAASALGDSFSGFEEFFGPLCGNPYRLGKEGVRGLGPDTGHDDLVTILREDWDAFSDAITDEMAWAILEEVWPNFSGEYMRLPAERWRAIEDAVGEIRTAILNGEPPEPLLGSLLDPWVELLAAPLGERTWFRARIQKGRGQVFAPSDMAAPPAGSPRFGRANPTGVSYLYVSSDAGTAVAEVRAEPGHWVSVAPIELTPNRRIVLDLARSARIIDPFATSNLEGALMARAFLDAFRSEMSRPILRGDEEREYRVTQAVASHFRTAKFDGIVFRSSIADGTNLVLFDPTAGEAGPVEERAVWAKALDVIDPREFDRRVRVRRGLPG